MKMSVNILFGVLLNTLLLCISAGGAVSSLFSKEIVSLAEFLGGEMLGMSSISYVVPSALESDTEVQDILDTLGRSGLSSLICDDEAVNVEEGSLYVFANFNVEGTSGRSDLLHHITSRMNSAKHVAVLMPEANLKDPPPDMKLRLDSLLHTWNIVQEGETVLAEVYAVRNGRKLVRREVGKWLWEPEEFEFTAPKEMWKRRKDLGGTVLRDIVLPFTPTIMEGFQEGFSVDLVDIIAKESNFSLIHYKPKDGQWGSHLDVEGNTFNGIVGELSRQEGDISITHLFATRERSTAVDFTATVLVDTVTAYVPASDGQQLPGGGAGAFTNFHIYSGVFRTATWWSVLLLLLAGASLAYLQTRLLKENLNLSRGQRFGLLNCLALVGLLVLQRDLPFSSGALSFKILSLTLSLLGFLLYNSYAARLTSDTIVPPVNTEQLDTFEALLDKGYEVAVLDNSAQSDSFRHAAPGGASGEIYETMKKNPKLLFKSFEEALALVTTPGERTVLYESYLKWNCRPQVSRLKDFKDEMHFPVSFALQKNSEYLDFFNHHLIKLEQSGVRRKLLEKWGVERTEDCGSLSADNGGKSHQETVVGYQEAAFPFLVLALGAAAVAILTWEVVRRRAGGNKGYFEAAQLKANFDQKDL